MIEGEKTAACVRFEQELESYLEGETQPFVRAHSRSCPDCSALLEDLEWLQRAAREMPLVDPPPAVWANVRARLDAEGAFRRRTSGWQKLWAWRAMPHAVPVGVMGVLMLLGGALSLPPHNASNWQTSEPAAPSLENTMSVTLPVGEEKSLARLVGELENNFRASEATISPDLKATYEKSLMSLDDSIRECLVSLQQEPRNRLTHEYLLTAYTRKAEVLSSALEFPGR